MSRIESERPLPQPTPISAPHWDACQRQILLVQRCSACGAYTFPPKEGCTACFDGELVWIESPGRGRIHSYSVVWRPQQPGFAVPYIAVVIELEEGWHMISNLVGCDPADVRVDMPVTLKFQKVNTEGFYLPMFRPD